jgi:hypothetical protein
MLKNPASRGGVAWLVPLARATRALGRASLDARSWGPSQAILGQ